MSKAKTNSTDPGTKPETDEQNTQPVKPAEAKDQTKHRYRLTEDFERRPGVTWPKGMQIDATAAEIQKDKIPAEQIS